MTRDRTDLDFSKLTTLDAYRATDEEGAELVNQMRHRAEVFIKTFRWCGEITSCHVGNAAVGGVVGVFLLQIAPTSADMEDWLWVVVGDLTPRWVSGSSHRRPDDRSKRSSQC